MKEKLAVMISRTGSLVQVDACKTSVNYTSSLLAGSFIANIFSYLLIGILVTLTVKKIQLNPDSNESQVDGGISIFSILISEYRLLLAYNKAGPSIAYALLSIMLGLVGMNAEIHLGKLLIR